MKRKIFYVFTLLSLIGCTARDEVKKERVVPVRVITITEGTDCTENNYIGTIEESAAISLSFPVAGNLQQLLADEGKFVNKGQVLAIVDRTSYQSTYAAAKSTLAQAKDAYKRMKELYDKGSLAEIKFVEVQTKLQQAEAMEQIAKKNLDDCVLTAPTSGMISECSVKPGQNVLPGIQIMELVQTDFVYVKIPVPEKEISSMQTGQKLNFTVNALNNKRFSGIIDKRGIIANPLSHTYEVKLKISNTKRDLMPGMVCQVSKLSEKTQSSNVIVPQKAIEVGFKGTHFVWVAQDGIAHKRDVHIGQLSNNGVSITDGLKPGDKVITEGQNKVSDGTKIKEL